MSAAGAPEMEKEMNELMAKLHDALSTAGGVTEKLQDMDTSRNGKINRLKFLKFLANMEEAKLTQEEGRKLFQRLLDVAEAGAEAGFFTVEAAASVLNGLDVKMLEEAAAKRKIAAEANKVRMTVLEGLELWLDASAEDTLVVSDQQVAEWRSRSECPATRRLVSEFGAPILEDFGPTCKAVEFDYNKSMRIEPPLGRIQTLISVHKFKPSEKSQFYILCGSKQGPFHGDSERITSGHGAWGWVGGKPFFDGTIRLNGTEGAVQETAIWTDGFKVATVTCTEPVPVPGGSGLQGMDRMGRDREYHEFAGFLAELLVFDRALDSSEIAVVEAYLRAKHSVLPGVV